MSAIPVPIEQLLPQRPPMLLLSRLLSCTSTEGTVEALLGPGHLFGQPDDTIHPAAFVELMAQAYAAVHGYQDHLAGKAPGIGYLAGVTQASVLGAARIGDQLTVNVRQTALIKPFVRARAQVVRNGETLAEGELTLFIPPEEAPS